MLVRKQKCPQAICDMGSNPPKSVFFKFARADWLLFFDWDFFLSSSRYIRLQNTLLIYAYIMLLHKFSFLIFLAEKHFWAHSDCGGCTWCTRQKSSCSGWFRSGSVIVSQKYIRHSAGYHQNSFNACWMSQKFLHIFFNCWG